MNCKDQMSALGKRETERARKCAKKMKKIPPAKWPILIFALLAVSPTHTHIQLANTGIERVTYTRA